MPGGYTGLFLTVDLISGKISRFVLEEEFFRLHIGGSAVAARLFLDGFPLDCDPLSGANPLIISTGPMTGSACPGTSRFSVCARSPLTGIWGESACGGTFGPELKRAGYDGLIITGRAPFPCYLRIEDGAAEIIEASEIWGKDIYETTDLLWSKHRSCRVLAIGPAGENLVRFASIGNDKGHFAGRTGLGAVMGAKNLKAIAVKGTGHPEKADKEGFKQALRSAAEEIRSSAFAGSLHAMGSDAGMDLGMMTGDVPIRNWTVGEDYDLSAALGGPALTEKYLVKAHACTHCPIACKRVVRVAEGPYRTEEGPGPEYETCCTFGTMIMNYDLAGVIKANELCNRYGMDTISCGSTVAMAMELFEKGLLSGRDTEGLDMAWGNMPAVFTLLGKIARREGFGGLLAEGSARAAERLGSAAAEASVHVKGLELPMHDPRAFHGMGLAYMVSNRGGCHLQHAVMGTEQGMVSWPQVFTMKDSYTGPESEDKAALVFHSENFGILGNSLAICHYVLYSLKPETVLKAFNVITGFGFGFSDLMVCGTRDWMLKRGINNLLGVTSRNDALPKRIMTALTEGAAAGSVPDTKKLLSEYYALRGLDKQGIPKEDRLRELGLDALNRRLAAVRAAEPVAKEEMKWQN